ncbi:MAG: hypothetical protein BWK76_25895 [Desulfobulbaceae bacterium A2]|nr:MAG: hypothetical protein BWK76_25895 [Desulfobulbaceae bacterium A2]
MSEEALQLHIDGHEVTTRAGTTILQAARAAGIDIPRLCHLPGRADSPRPCLLCLVEVDGAQVRACCTPAAAGMRVETATHTAGCIGMFLEFLGVNAP